MSSDHVAELPAARGPDRRRSTFWLINGAAFLVLVYLLFPLVAGLLAIGRRDGPKIYLRDHHELLYRIGYALDHDDKPRIPVDWGRPWFYGMESEQLTANGTLRYVGVIPEAFIEPCAVAIEDLEINGFTDYLRANGFHVSYNPTHVSSGPPPAMTLVASVTTWNDVLTLAALRYGVGITVRGSDRIAITEP